MSLKRELSSDWFNELIEGAKKGDKDAVYELYVFFKTGYLNPEQCSIYKKLFGTNIQEEKSHKVLSNKAKGFLLLGMIVLILICTYIFR